jgi:TfuA protein
MRPVVFLGPSLPISEACPVLDADYRPPVRRGDLRSIPVDVSIVAIIDGVLMTDAAVGHREIIELMRSGVKVIGGGSMGALRASELSSLGMIGVGRIFEAYSSGRIEGDDEVVLGYEPSSGLPLSEPLINLRLNLEKAERGGIIDHQECQTIIDELKKTYFPDRDIELMMKIANERLDVHRYNALESFFYKRFEDFKRIDAMAVLNMVKSYEHAQ